MVAVVCWVLLALIHLLPASALFRPALIETIYGVPPGSAAFMLLHHRAALFLVVMTICLWAAWRPEVRSLATVAVAISMVSFLWLYAAAGQPISLRLIALVDLAGLPALLLAGWLALKPAPDT